MTSESIVLSTVASGERSTFSRRQVLAGLMSAGVVTIVGTSPVAGAMKALAMPASNDNRVLVNVFLRGGCDGLSVVVPHGDAEYYRHRGSIAQARDTLFDLDGFFGLNQSFGALNPLYQEGELCFIQAVGSNDKTRSHFSAMDNMDLAFGSSGWMQRALATLGDGDPLAALSVEKRTSPSLRGPYSGIAYDRLASFRQSTAAMSFMRPTLEAMYLNGSDRLTGDATTEAFTSIDRLSGVSVNPSVQYPRNGTARDFQEAAALIKADVGVRMVSINIGGWDHHSDLNSRMPVKGEQLSEALAAFKADLGGESDRVLTLVMSEFGRAVRKNGSGGTDHGHGNMMMVMGGGLGGRGGGKVHLRNNSWVGLSSSQLHDNRDLAITTDFRSVLAEALEKHMGIADDGRIFPRYQPEFLGLLSAGGTPPTTTPTSVTSTTIAGTTSTLPGGSGTGPSTTDPSGSTTSSTGNGPGDSSTAPSSTGPTTTAPTTTIVSSTTEPSTTTSTVPGGWISGVVTYVDGRPAAGTKIDLFRSIDGKRNGFLGVTRTNAAGEYLFESPAGPHILTFIAPSGDEFVEGKQFHQPSVFVDSGQTSNGVNATLIGAALADSGSIGGTIINGQGIAAIDIKIDLFKARGDGSRGRFLVSTRSDANGGYRFDVPAGCYILTMIAPDGGRFSNNRRWHQPAICIAANEAASGLDARLAAGAG